MAPKPQTTATAVDSPAPPATTAASSKDGSEVPTPNPQSRNSSPSSSDPGASSKKSDPESTTAAKGASPAQPTAKASSNSSATDAKDAAGNGISPYGTRSRNRTGRARPNYAEDKDFDMDFDNYPDKKDDSDSKKPMKQANIPPTPSEAPRTATPSTRKPLPNGDGAKQAATPKDPSQQPGQSHAPAPSSTSVASAATATTAQSSKKRKAGAQNGGGNANQSQTNAAQAPAASASNQRKSSGGVLTGYAESNMMSFDNCKGRPINDTLVADDGTTLAVNGKPSLMRGMHLVRSERWFD